MICFWSCSFLAHEARGGHFRHRFEVPKSIDFGIQEGIHFGPFLSKNTCVFNRCLYLNWGPFLGPFFGALIFWRVHLLSSNTTIWVFFGLSRTVFEVRKVTHFSTPKMGPKIVYFGVFSESIFGSIFWDHFFLTGPSLVFKHYHLGWVGPKNGPKNGP